MPYTIRTKRDGLEITNVPDEMKSDSQELKAFVERMRASGEKSGDFSSQAIQPEEQQLQTPELEDQANGWQDTEYGFKVRPIDLGGGAQSVQREDGLVWFGPEQGNEGKPGWFDAQGLRGGASPGEQPSANDRAINDFLQRQRRSELRMQEAPMLAASPFPESMMAAGSGLAKAVLGGARLLARVPLPGDEARTVFGGAMSPESRRQFVDQQVEGYSRESERLVGSHPVAEIAGQMTIPMGGAPKLARLSGKPVMARLARMGIGSAEGAVVAPLTSEGSYGSEDEYLAGKKGEALLGGTIGGVVRGVTSGLSRKAAEIAPTQAASEAEKAGIKVLTSDVYPPQTWAAKWLRGAGEKIPWAGTGGMRAKQQAQRVQAIRDLLIEYGATDVAKASDDVMASLLAKRKESLVKYVGMKDGVFSKLKAAGGVPTPSTDAAIDTEIAALKALDAPWLNDTVQILTDWKAALKGKTIDQVDTLRQQIGKVFERPDLASAKDAAQKSLNKIYGHVNEDIGNFIKANGEKSDYTKWRVANARLADSMSELRIDALASALKKGEQTPEVIRKILFSAKPSDVRLLMKNLPPAGRDRARTAILAEAAEKSGGIDEISAEKFISNVKRLASPVGVMFEGAEGARLKGLVSALKLTSQAAKAGVSPQTGALLLPIAGADILISSLGGPGAASATAGLVGLASRLYESKVGRELLIKLGSAKPGGPEEVAIFRALVKTLNREQEKEQPK